MANILKVGIGVMIQKEGKEVLLGLRQGSHGEGEWCFPGGSQDFGETLEECVRREVLEETGLKVGKIELISLADELKYIESDGKHFVNIGFKAEYIGGEPDIKEPEKCMEWKWWKQDAIPNNLLEGTSLIFKALKRGTIYE